MLKPQVKSFYEENTQTWTYVVFAENSSNKKCAVIDSVLDFDIHSGQSKTVFADKIVDFIKSNNLELEWILETHIHADHLTAAQYLKEKLGGKTAITRHILDILDTWEKVFHNEADTPKDGSQFDYLFGDNEEFFIGELKANIIHSPGHTPADCSYIIGENIFVGDAIFMPDVGSGRCDFPGGNAKDSFLSIQKLLAYPDYYKLYVGHDYPPNNQRSPACFATIKEQKEQNIRIKANISEQAFVEKRNQDDKGKQVPKLLLPSIQVNLRAGCFGEKTKGVHYVKIPLNQLG